jgi:Uma2 family endonuclease
MIVPTNGLQPQLILRFLGWYVLAGFVLRPWCTGTPGSRAGPKLNAYRLPLDTAVMADVERRQFTVTEFVRMGEVGIFSEQERVELFEGEIIRMNPVGARHVAVVNQLHDLFYRLLGETAIVSMQTPIVLDEHSQPLPDLVLLRPRTDGYGSAPPRAADVLLLVEVAETTRQYDTVRKPRAYARSGIAEVWVVVLDRDRARDRIEVFADRARSAYRRSRICERGDELAPELFPRCQLRVTDILA